LQGKASFCNDYKKKILFSKYDIEEERKKIRNKLLVLYLYKYDTLFDRMFLKGLLDFDGKFNDYSEINTNVDIHDKIFNISFENSLFLFTKNSNIWNDLKSNTQMDLVENFMPN